MRPGPWPGTCFCLLKVLQNLDTVEMKASLHLSSTLCQALLTGGHHTEPFSNHPSIHNVSGHLPPAKTCAGAGK